MKLNVILEKSDTDLFGSISIAEFSHNTVGKDIAEVTNNLKGLIQDYIEHEGKEDPKWKDLDVNTIEFDYTYDLTAFFETFDMLKITRIAEIAGLNASLVRQYVTGKKHPSLQQAKKIEEVVHRLGKELLSVSIS
jgi:predicted RNase H-like HicB family nuclease